MNEIEKYSPASLIRIKNSIELINRILTSTQNKKKKILILNDGTYPIDALSSTLIANNYSLSLSEIDYTNHRENQNNIMHFECILLCSNKQQLKTIEMLRHLRKSNLMIPIIIITDKHISDYNTILFRNGVDFIICEEDSIKLKGTQHIEHLEIIERLINRHVYLHDKRISKSKELKDKNDNFEVSFSTNQFENKKLLVVNDDETICYLLKEQLIEAGYLVDHCYDGEQALKYIQRNNYDCVLLNLEMPNINGYKVLDIVRKSNHDLPIIIHSGESFSWAIATCIQKGADYYVLLPYELDELLAIIRRVLEIYNV